VIALAGCGQIARSRADEPRADSGVDSDSGRDSDSGADSVAGDAGMEDSLPEMAGEAEATEASSAGDVGGAFEGGDDGAMPPACPILEAPSTCERAPYDCGLTGDGLGNVLQCGACPLPFACAVGHCVWPGDAAPCVRATCADYDARCGAVGDGCGGTLDCGGCEPPAYCGGGGLRRCGGTCATEPVSRDADCGVTVVCRPGM
jgi:hypothetical protein